MARVSFAAKIDEEVAARSRRAVAALQQRDHRFTLAQLVEDALAAHVDALEQEHNDGRPFPTPRHPLMRGRRLET